MRMFTFAEDQVSGTSCRQRAIPMTAVAAVLAAGLTAFLAPAPAAAQDAKADASIHAARFNYYEKALQALKEEFGRTTPMPP